MKLQQAKAIAERIKHIAKELNEAVQQARAINLNVEVDVYEGNSDKSRVVVKILVRPDDIDV